MGCETFYILGEGGSRPPSHPHSTTLDLSDTSMHLSDIPVCICLLKFCPGDIKSISSPPLPPRLLLGVVSYKCILISDECKYLLSYKCSVPL